MERIDVPPGSTRDDFEACLRLLRVLEREVATPEQLVSACVKGLADLIPQSRASFVVGVDGARTGWNIELCDDTPPRPRLVLTHAAGRFSERDGARLALIAPHLGFLYAQACRNAQRSPAWMLQAITPREQEVLRWVSRGKTDADIAGLLAISRRTVHKHLEHIYVKLGVETRTAAVMRVRGAD